MTRTVQTYAAIDVETTGYSPDAHEIVEIAIVQFTLRESADDKVMLDSIVRPKRRVPNWRVHGITNRMVRRAPFFEEIAGTIFDALANSIVVCHNARFDLSFLQAAFRRLDARFQVPYLCTLRMKEVLGLGGSGKLADQCSFFSIEVPGEPHTALHDALSTIAVLRAFLSYAGLFEESALNEALGREALEASGDIDIEPLTQGSFSDLNRSTKFLTRKDV